MENQKNNVSKYESAPASEKDKYYRLFEEAELVWSVKIWLQQYQPPAGWESSVWAYAYAEMPISSTVHQDIERAKEQLNFEE